MASAAQSRERLSGVRKALALSPVAAGLLYPLLLEQFHAALRPDGVGLAAMVALAAAFAVPLYTLLVATRLGGAAAPSRFERRARRLAYLAMAAPPLFVLAGVSLGLLGAPIRDRTLWVIGWLGALLFGATASDAPADERADDVSRFRVVHGLSAAFLAVFLLFHLGNHMTGLLGPSVHAAVMDVGRAIYRSRLIEPAFIALLLWQLASGARLAARWTGSPADAYRSVQIGSGIYVGAFVLTHLNSALVSARLVRGIPTDWAWASGAPDGLIRDAWNVRLLPHYGFGVCFLLVHLFAGLRVVLLAHGTTRRTADRLWLASAIVSAAIAAAILAALCGARL